MTLKVRNLILLLPFTGLNEEPSIITLANSAAPAAV
jgi:hypothetical protein